MEYPIGTKVKVYMGRAEDVKYDPEEVRDAEVLGYAGTFCHINIDGEEGLAFPDHVKLPEDMEFEFQKPKQRSKAKPGPVGGIAGGATLHIAPQPDDDDDDTDDEDEEENEDMTDEEKQEAVEAWAGDEDWTEDSNYDPAQAVCEECGSHNVVNGQCEDCGWQDEYICTHCGKRYKVSLMDQGMGCSPCGANICPNCILPPDPVHLRYHSPVCPCCGEAVEA